MKKVNNIMIILISILSLITLGYILKNGEVDILSRVLSCLTSIIVILIPRIINKIFKISLSSRMEFVYLIFIFLALFLGSAVDLYSEISWYDLFTHFISGVLTSILAIFILNWFKISSKNKWFNILFMTSFTLMIASLWEFIEFGTFVFLKMDVQNNLTTGVFDTMEDMLVAFLGNIIVCSGYLFKNRK